MELMQLQQETEAKYVAALNELQMLKVQRDIAQTNKDIASAKLDTVSAEKNIVTLLTPETNNNYASRLTNPTQGVPTGPGNGPPIPIVETAYTVISVTEIQGQWAAVIGAGGKLYNVHIGDVIPDDNSKVISINRGGVVLQKGETKRTVSLVPII
jgi:type IV pilus biogenesis protein PilP